MREQTIFPGHPLVIATIIMKHYPNLDEAFAKKEDHSFPNALEDQNIPGAGGNVYSALDALRYVRDGLMGIDKAVEFCNEVWASCDDNQRLHPEKYERGMAEAKEYEMVFRGMLKGRGYGN